jgi:hypothetical protein
MAFMAFSFMTIYLRTQQENKSDHKRLFLAWRGARQARIRHLRFSCGQAQRHCGHQRPRRRWLASLCGRPSFAAAP